MRRLWKRVEWPLVAVLGLAAFVLGFTGFAAFFRALGDSRSSWDVFYLTLQLFVLESGSVSGPVPWQLQVARLLAPAVAGYTAVRALAILFRERFDRFRVRFLRGHVVIGGLGRKGLLLAKSLRQRGDPVVVIEEDAENDLIETARGYRAVVLVGDARDPQVLRSAGVRRASHVVAVSGDDGVNAEVAVQARALVADRGGAPLSCLVHIVDPQLCNLLRMQEIGRRHDEAFRLDFFNVFESGARNLLDEPVAGKKAEGEPWRGHIVIVGLGQFGESLVLQAAARWRAANGALEDRPRVTIVDQAAGPLKESLSVRYPWLDQVCELQPQEMAFESREFVEAGFLFDLQGNLDVSTIYVCIDDDSQGLITALTLHPHIKGRGVPIVVRMVHGAGLASLLRQEPLTEGEYAELHAFGLLDCMCNPDVLLAGAYEILARAMHDEYVRERKKQGDSEETDSAMKPWDELKERYKESNRAQAAHIGVKLADVDCDLAPLTDWDAESFRFKPDELEHLAMLEHDRWTKERQDAGWTPGPRDSARKTSPYLVPWSELDEEIKEYDRIFIRGLPRFLARAGFQIVRLEGGPHSRAGSRTMAT
ncbi:MAG: hypothetical protein HKM89_04540 [Gemmatimonadales bacterium]|nr:hypothetical protein [Gemmatimonadales bacterium]